MIYELENGNRIVASADFMAQQYPQGGYVLIGENPKPARFYNSLEFYRLFGLPKHAEILQAAKTDTFIEALLQWIAAAGGCYLNAPETVQGVGYLVSVGLLTEQQAAAVLSGQSIA